MIVVTGAGLVTPLGSTLDEFWASCLAGRVASVEVEEFDTSPFHAHRGCPIRGFRLEEHFPGRFPAGAGRASRLAVAAAWKALQDAGLEGALEGVPVAVSLGTTAGDSELSEAFSRADFEGRPGDIPADGHVHCPGGSLSAHVAAALGLQGEAVTFSTACAAANYSLIHGVHRLREGRAEVALCGGSDHFSSLMFTGFHRLGALAPDVPRPFDLDRKGLQVGEAAGVLVLETAERARARGARVRGVVLGYGLSCDGYHMTAMHPDGRGIAAATRKALAMAGLGPERVDYVSAHGTGTPANDAAECAALRQVFGERRVPVSSLKSLMGHSMGAASAVEAIACLLSLETGMVHPTAGFRTPDPACPVDCVPEGARRVDPRIVLNQAYAFGGNNSSLVLGRW